MKFRVNQEAIGGCWYKNKSWMRPELFWCLCFKEKVHAEVLQQKYWPQSCYHLLNSAFWKSKRKHFLCPWQKIRGSWENSSWRSLVQSSATVMVSSAIRPSSLGLYPVRPWKSPRERTPYLSVRPVPLLDCSHGEKDFLPIQAEAFLFQYMNVVLHLPTVRFCEGMPSRASRPGHAWEVGPCEPHEVQ